MNDLNKKLDKLEEELSGISSDNSLMRQQYDNSMSIINSEHMIREYENQLKYLDSIASSNESSLALGYIGTGIAESTKGLCDKFINLVGTVANVGGNKLSPYKTVSTLYDKTQGLISAKYSDSKEESIAHLAGVVIPDGDAYNSLRVLKEAALLAIKNGNNAELEQLIQAMKTLAQASNNPIAQGIVNDMQANYEIMKGLNTISQYGEEKEAMLLKIAEEKAKINYRIAREKEKLARLKKQEAEMLNQQKDVIAEKKDNLLYKTEKLLATIKAV
jgi:hypothetical protein